MKKLIRDMKCVTYQKTSDTMVPTAGAMQTFCYMTPAMQVWLALARCKIFTMIMLDHNNKHWDQFCLRDGRYAGL